MHNQDSYDLFCFMTLQAYHVPANENDVECACRNFLETEGYGESIKTLTGQRAAAHAAQLIPTTSTIL